MAAFTMTTGIRPSPSDRSADLSPLTAWLYRQSVRLSDWLAFQLLYKSTVHELSGLSDRELDDIGINRCDIRRIAQESAAPAKSTR